VWWDDGVKAGSRNRELSLDNDNAGFMNAMVADKAVNLVLSVNRNFILYGEWLVPHTLKTYNDDAWRKFYVFDVYDRNKERLLSYDEYSEGLVAAGINVIAPIAIIKNGTEAHFTECLSKAHYLVKDGEGAGEGVVVKNYDYKNKYGRQTWAKIVANEFKAKHHIAMGAPVVGCEIVEEKIVAKYVTQALVDKVVAKITNEMEGWSSKYIPRLIHTVYYDLVTEETWNFVKEFRNPKVDFKVLSHYTTAKIKQIKPELF
jgi:ATP-dependent RNA circularization protein (DNA/RNA ligase family)